MDKKKRCRKCTDEYTIHCLPYTINKPGRYCLSKNFAWADNEKSAITIESRNVILNFNERRIQVSVATTVPIILVQNSQDIVLNNIDIEAIESATYQVEGLDIISSNNITINNPVFLNLNFALYTELCENVNVNDLRLKNDLPNVTTSILFNNSTNIKYYDSQVINGRSIIRESENVDVQRIQVKNISRRAIQVDSVVGKVGTASLQPLKISNNVKIANSEFFVSGQIQTVGIVGLPLGAGIGPYSYPVKNVVLENNNIFSENNLGVLFQYSLGGTVKNNQVYGLSGLAVSGEGNLIQNNTVKAEQPQGQGIVVESPFALPLLPTKHNTVDGNTVSGFAIGYADKMAPGTEAFCTIFKNNVASGNANNFFINTSPPQNSFYASNNISHCQTLPLFELVNFIVDREI